MSEVGDCIQKYSSNILRKSSISETSHEGTIRNDVGGHSLTINFPTNSNTSTSVENERECVIGAPEAPFSQKTINTSSTYYKEKKRSVFYNNKVNTRISSKSICKKETLNERNINLKKNKKLYHRWIVLL